jgi:hypothetical protein
MRRPSVVVALAVALFAAGCGASEPPFDPDPTAPSPAATAPAATLGCDPPPEPRPEASPEASGSARRAPIVLAESTGSPDVINGSLRLCLGGDLVAQSAGGAGCTWDATRAHLLGVTAELEVEGHALFVFADVGHAAQRLEIGYDRGGYASAMAAVPVDAGERWRSGVAGPFAVDLVQPPDSPATIPLGGPGGPRSLVAVVRWQCLPPPPPPPGVAAGEVTFHIQSPVDRVLTAPAVCRWRAGDPAFVEEVESWEHRAALGPDRSATVALRNPTGDPEVELFVTRADHRRWGDYGMADSTRTTPLASTGDGSSGRLWVRGLDLQALGADESNPIDGVSRRVALDVSWQCQRPDVPPDVAEARQRPPERQGRMTLTLRAPLQETAVGAIRCVLDPSLDEGTSATVISGRVELAAESWVLDARGSTLVIVRIGRDGRVVGEYEHQWFVSGNDVDTTIGHDTFVAMGEPDPPAVVSAALGPAARPAALALSFELDCRPR